MMAAKMMMPPIVGTLRLWSLRASEGSSTRCFMRATLIRLGMVSSTTMNEVRKPRSRI